MDALFPAQISGRPLLGARDGEGLAENAFVARDPASGAPLPGSFHPASPAEVDAVCALAEAAAEPFARTPPETRAALLEAIAEGLEGLGEPLIERAMAETGLPRARLEGERGRTAGQLRLFARLLRDGSWQQPVLDRAQPGRQPLPRPELRLGWVPLGPVAVFGASNFPLAFSVAGGDTASALAAGCPVVVKAHPSHPGTSELAGRAIRHAVARLGLPEGVFSLVGGPGAEVGEALVRHPAVQAVGFTGSRAGGLALTRLAQARPRPIPVYAEMSAINPVLMLPGALAERAGRLAAGLADSLTLGVGQFCTNPGLVLGIDSPDWQDFVRALAEAVAAKPAGVMLNAGIHAAYRRGAAELRARPGVQLVGQGRPAEGEGCLAQAQVCAASAADFLAQPALGDEVFGPGTLLVRCASADELHALLRRLEGQLTATLHIAEAEGEARRGDLALARRLLPTLERKAGRLLVNGFPTGVEVCHAMVHGGPFPATSDSRGTSVGAQALARFLRPVCYQDLPSELLPETLRDEALARGAHWLDGRLVPAPAGETIP